ncbi:TlpA family protein disulfide reductase [Pseudocolwellia sp. HL-MZ19]|uniref:TlpA family protein disulfide reductase n=1 Tax=unclassified Pseudocolwellia TaxID=2848178 RepID=UPI003CEDD735
MINRNYTLGHKLALVMLLGCLSYSVHSASVRNMLDTFNAEFELSLLQTSILDDESLLEVAGHTHGHLPESSPKLRLSDYKGKVLYIDFWASWCGPCVVSMPLLNDLRNTHKDAGFEVIAINLDEDLLLAAQFIKQVNIDYPVVSDIHGIVGKQYKVNGLPTAYIIDANGKVQLIHKGFKKSDINFIEAVVDKALSEVE